MMPTAKRKHAKAEAEVVIPEKIYFRIGEVSELAKLPTYVLRFWETEFAQLKPTKSSTGQRMYRRKDVEYVMQIRRLLYEDGFTIAGARERLREEMRSNRAGKQAAEEVSNPGPDKASRSAAFPEDSSAYASSPGASSEEALQERAPDGLNDAPHVASYAATDAQQAALPFLAVSVRENGKDALRKLRQQLCEVLDLLS